MPAEAKRAPNEAEAGGSPCVKLTFRGSGIQNVWVLFFRFRTKVRECDVGVEDEWARRGSLSV